MPMVIARIYDPRRADIYRDLGIPTVASVRWTVAADPADAAAPISPRSSRSATARRYWSRELPGYLAGRPLAEFEVDGEIRVGRGHPGAAARSSRSAAPLLEAGDLVTFAVAAPRSAGCASFLDKELGT